VSPPKFAHLNNTQVGIGSGAGCTPGVNASESVSGTVPELRMQWVHRWIPADLGIWVPRQKVLQGSHVALKTAHRPAAVSSPKLSQAPLLHF